MEISNNAFNNNGDPVIAFSLDEAVDSVGLTAKDPYHVKQINPGNPQNSYNFQDSEADREKFLNLYGDSTRINGRFYGRSANEDEFLNCYGDATRRS